MRRSLSTSFLIGMALVSSLSAAEPVKQAAEARFDLQADVPAAAINDGRVIAGHGSIARMNWISESDQPRGYTVTMPVSHLGWRTLSVRFMPARSGSVALQLMGPYQEASKGVVFRQEVLWDDVRVEGATLEGGGFEWRPATIPPAWRTGGGSVVTAPADVPALEGQHFARTWHNQTLSAMIPVTGGQAVTVTLHARAVAVPGERAMKRIVSRTTPAHRAARRFLRGANLGNDLEAPPGQDWRVHYTQKDVRIIQAEGFDHVRIPIGWHHYTGPAPDFRIRPEIFARADALVTAGLRQGLAVLINVHHFDDFTSHPQEETPRLIAIWRQVAEHYGNASDSLAFEILNEPRDAATTEVINPIFARVITEIRKVAPNRTIFVGPGQWNSISELPKLSLPDDDENLIVTVHNYDPFLFSHQGATWTGSDTKLTGILFPGPPPRPLVPDPALQLKPWILDWVKTYNTEPAATNPSGPVAFQGAIESAKEWSEYFGRPIHVGEFGSFTEADALSRAHYYRAFREAAERAHLGWAIWDWKAGFRYWNENTKSPEPGIHEALFGRSSDSGHQPVQ